MLRILSVSTAPQGTLMISFAHDNPDLARAYDRLSDSQFEGGKTLVDRLAVKPGDCVLDVGCGTGRLAGWIAERVAPGGRVVGIDPLPDRIAIARTRAPAEVSFDVGQAEDLSAFGSETFDAVCMSAVFHWVPDKRKALAEARRVLRDGGRLGVTTLPSDLRSATTVARVCTAVLAAPRYRDVANVAGFAFGLGTTETIAMLLESQLELAELHVVERTRHHPSGQAVVDFLEASSFGNFLGIVPEDLRPSLRADVAAAFDERKGNDGIALRDYGMVFVARRRDPR
jgi:arsenite methyltransferase